MQNCKIKNILLRVKTRTLSTHKDSILQYLSATLNLHILKLLMYDTTDFCSLNFSAIT